MKMWLTTGALLEKNRKATLQRRYTIYYITAKYDPQNGVCRIVFCNRNGKEIFYNNAFYTDLRECIRAARQTAFRGDFRFVLPESGV